jgi:mycothiol synthase
LVAGLIALPEAPAIPGLTFRRFHGSTDLAGIAAVMNASLAADRNGERNTAEGLANSFAHPVNWDPQQDTLLVEVNGTLIGYANTEWREADDNDCQHAIQLHLAPEWRGRGLESAMQCDMERRAQAAAAAGPTGARHWFSSRVPETWRTCAEMLLAQGYTSVRCFFEMQRTLDGDLPDASLPAGLAFRPALPGHYRAIWAAGAECYRDQWEHVALSDEDYHVWAATPDLDPSLWLVAWDGDQIAGAAINVVHKSECGQQDTWGETDDLFVRRLWRQRGLGRALLVGSLCLFKARGLITAGLGVDAENLSGALRLYEGLGYRVYQRVVMYRKPM